MGGEKWGIRVKLMVKRFWVAAIGGPFGQRPEQREMLRQQSARNCAIALGRTKDWNEGGGGGRTIAKKFRSAECMSSGRLQQKRQNQTSREIFSKIA